MAYSGPGHVTSGATPLLQAESITFELNANNKPVLTLSLGYAGHSPGAVEISGSVANAIPAGGPEIDWIAVATAQQEIPLGFTIARRTYNAIVNIGNVEYGTSVSDANKMTFKFAGRLVNIVASP